MEKRQCDAASIARDTNIRTMEEAIAKFFELHGKLASGESFYTNLQMRLSKLYRSCEDIAFSQQLQRQEFEQNMIREQERSVQVSYSDLPFSSTILVTFSGHLVGAKRSGYGPAALS